tara:strand:- start:878 stop:1963 length:1086 start_codon:yes stop_codon:yes gene_type:complete
MSKHESALSASRIKTLQQCSWKYWCNYKLKLPDKSNDGASRGWICHLIFELLGEPRHKKHYDLITSEGSIFASKPIQKLVLYHAKKLDVDDDDNLNLIDSMTVNGLHCDFFGEDEQVPDEAISEKDFDIEIEGEGVSYRIKGFIDKLFLYKDKSFALIRDFKSSKQVFKGKEVTDNLQHLMYSLAVKHMYPEFKTRESEFLFLKFDLTKDMFKNNGKGVLSMSMVSEEELIGLEYELTEIQSYIDSFDEDKAVSNFAANQPYPSDGTFGGPLACGKDGYKMSRGQPVLDDKGNPIPAFICSYRKPFSYYALKDSNGKVLKTCFIEDKEDLIAKQKEGQEVVLMEYAGCPHWKEPEHNDLFD